MQSPLEDETGVEADLVTDNARKPPDVEVSTIAGAIPAVSFTKDTSWFRRLVAAGPLRKVDGVWTRTVRFLTTSRVHVDSVCPIAGTAYVYYDNDVYDSVLTDKTTGLTYVTQLIFDSETKVYYVYYRWGGIDHRLHGPYETIESAKKTFQVIYNEMFDVEWAERETTTTEKWTYHVKTYETYEEIEDVEEVVEETEAALIISRRKDIVVDNDDFGQTDTLTTEIQRDSVIQQSQEKVVVHVVHDEVKSKERVNATAEEEQQSVEMTTETIVESIAISEPAQEHDPFVLEKTRPSAGGKKGGSAGLSTIAVAAVIGASQM